jgi:hypothetical protein
MTTKREWKKRKELLQEALTQIFNEKPDERYKYCLKHSLK